MARRDNLYPNIEECKCLLGTLPLPTADMTDGLWALAPPMADITDPSWHCFPWSPHKTSAVSLPGRQPEAMDQSFHLL